MFETDTDRNEQHLVLNELLPPEVRAAGRRAWLEATDRACAIPHPVAVGAQTVRNIVFDYGAGFFGRRLAQLGTAGHIEKRKTDDGLQFWAVSDQSGNTVILRLNFIDGAMRCAINKTDQSRWLSNPNHPYLFTGLEESETAGSAEDRSVLGVAVIGYNQSHTFSDPCLSYFVFHSRRHGRWWLSIDEESGGNIVMPSRRIPDAMRNRRSRRAE